MKRVALALLLSLATSGPFVSTARADGKPARQRPARHHVSAHDVSLLASLIFMPWSAMALAHRGAKPHPRAKAPASKSPSRDAAPAAAAAPASTRPVNAGDEGAANPPSQQAAAASSSAP